MNTDLERFASVPRDVRLTSGGIALVVLSLAFAAGAVAAAVGLSALRIRQQAEAATFQRGGVMTTAEVMSLGPPRGDERRRAVTFRYEAGGSTWTGSGTLSRREWTGRTPGDRIPVRYLEADPARVRVAGHEPRALPIAVVPLCSLGLLAAAGLLAWRVRRDWALLSEGRFAEARVLESKTVQRQHHRAYRVRYEFRVLSGALVIAEMERGGKPPEIGAVVPIVYNRENPYRVALYPMSLVRPVKR